MTTDRPATHALSGWGRYPVEETRLYRPDRRHQLDAIVTHAPESSLLARGRGRSYGDAALNREGAVLSLERINRILHVD